MRDRRAALDRIYRARTLSPPPIIPIPLFRKAKARLEVHLGRNIGLKLVSEANKTLRTAIKGRDRLTDTDFRLVVNSTRAHLNASGPVIDAKRSPRDNSKILLSVDVDGASTEEN